MASKTVKVGSLVGLHARPAIVIAEAAAVYNDDVTLTLADDPLEHADASSSLMIMALGADYGDNVTVTSDNATAVEAIVALIEKQLDGDATDPAGDLAGDWS